MLLVEDDQMVQVLTPEGPDESLNHCVRTRARYRCGNGINPDPSDPLAEVATVDRIMIVEQMARLLPHGVASINWRQTQAVVGLAVTLACTSSRRPWAMNTSTYRVLNVSVCTVSRSAAQR